MLGNDAFGRKVSLLNDADCSSKASSAAAPSSNSSKKSLSTAAGRCSSRPALQSPGSSVSKVSLSLSHRHRPDPLRHHSISAAVPSRRSPPTALQRGRSDTAFSHRSSDSSRTPPGLRSDPQSAGTSPPSSTSSSRAGSAASSPKLRPLHHASTPALSRHHSGVSTQSTDSTGSRQTLPTPSPMTPTYHFDPLDQTKAPLLNPADPYYRATAGPYFAPSAVSQQQPQQQPLPTIPLQIAQSYYAANPSAAGGVAPLDDGFAMSAQYPNLNAAFNFNSAELMQPASLGLANPPPVALPRASAAAPVPTAATPASAASPTSPASASASAGPPSGSSSSSAAAAKPARKKYPCPHAARFHCPDTFTTSGHAARHGKKHTGEKNILCPTCHKAFTRKDNMKQHERTHRPNRDAAPGVSATTAEPGKRAKASSGASATLADARAAAAAAHPPYPAKSASASLEPASPASAATTQHASSPALTLADLQSPTRLTASAATLDAPLPSLTAPTASLSLGTDPTGAAGGAPDVMDFDIDPTIGAPEGHHSGGDGRGRGGDCGRGRGGPMCAGLGSAPETPASAAAALGARKLVLVDAGDGRAAVVVGKDGGSDGGSPGLDALALAASGLS